MKKTILSLMLGRGRGGLESVFVQHVLNFQEMGYRSVVLCHPQFPDVNQFRAKGIEVVPMKNKLWNPFVWLTLIRVLLKYRPAVLCMHGNRAITFGAAKWIRLFVRPFPKLMATTHNARNKRFPKLDGCFAITHVLEKSLINDFGISASKVFYCPDAVSTPKVVFPRTYRMPMTIGFLGRFHPVKGGDILLEACRILKEQGLSFRLEMAGDGALCEEYQAFVRTHHLEANVNFLGWIEEHEKEDFFRKIDLLCLPSRSEALSVTLLESIAHAIPVVVSACPGMMEVVNVRQCGLIFPIEDIEALVNALKTILENRVLWEQCSIAAYETFKIDYTMESQKEFLKKGIESVCVD